MHARCIVACAIAVAMLGASAGAEFPAAPRQKICLNGVWDFKAAGTAEDAVPEDGWTTLPVPSTWYCYGPLVFTISQADAASPHAWYRRAFAVPKSWADGRRVKLLFLALDWANTVVVNGKVVAANDSQRLCLSVDITDHVRFGAENTLSVWTKRRNKTDRDGGIIRSVYLTTVPAVHVEYAHAMSSVSKMTLTVRTRVRNDGKTNRSVTVRPTVVDNGRTVLVLPPVQVDVPAGKSAEIETTAPWKNPVLWGFGEYGRPHLYHLRTAVAGEGCVGDVTDERFGFREFTTRRDKFVFNGKEFFIKGDLIARSWPVLDNPASMVAFYASMRATNINFQRLHGTHINNFEPHYWYSVADELGHLVESQLEETRKPTDDPEHLALWTSYVNYHFNHPSLVMWCPDNEGLHLERWVDRAEDVIPPWNRLATHIRRLDPTRIIDFNHGHALFAAVKMGLFDRENFMTFNPHPYGNVVAELAKKKRELGFDDSVPTLIGEVFNFPARLDMLEDPRGSFVEQRRQGRVFHDDILRLGKAGVAGIVLCAVQTTGYLGFEDSKTMHLGPWSEYCATRERGRVDGAMIAEDTGLVKVRWPSFSGEGMKIELMWPYFGSSGADGGYGFGMNGFDPNQPMFRTNIVDRQVAKAYAEVNGKAEPPLGPERALEVVVCFGVDGKPVEGAYVHLTPLDGQARIPAVATDRDGTAWFHLWDTGRYEAVAWHDGASYEKPVTLTARPKFTEKAGYDHLVWVDLDGIDIAARKADLAKPAEHVGGMIRRRGELLPGGDMEYWPTATNVGGWVQSIRRETEAVHSGKYSAAVLGNGVLTRQFRMASGEKYKVSGWIHKGAGVRRGSIGLRSGDWTWLLKLDGSDTVGEWKYVEAIYTASGAETYFYCWNDYMGNEGLCYYDDISITLHAEAPAAALQPGPFPVGKDGYISHWLVCGPFPNSQVVKGAESRFVGHHTDLLAGYGGEANVAAKYGQKYTIDFPADGPWLEGKDVLTWRDIHGGDKIDLKGLVLPSRGITARPPSLVCAYLACTLTSPTAQTVEVAIGSDDGNKVWLNGELVGENEVMRGSQPDQDIHPATLKKGENRLLVKIFQHVGGWNFYLRFLDDGKKPVTDLTVRLDE